VETMIKNISLMEIAKVFLKLGFTGLGGPVVHIAMMRTEVVVKRSWLSEAEFVDLIGAANLIPGPNSTELAIFIGHKLKGHKGLLVAGLSFILPAFFIVLGLAIIYQKYGALPDTTSIFFGMRPVIIAVVLVAIWKFTRTAVTDYSTVFILALAAFLTFLGVHELTIIFGLGLFHLATHKMIKTKLGLSVELLLFFLKVGSVLFGSGYVLIAYLKRGLIEHHGWLTNAQLMDAITIGQVTPGPVFTTATFVGYLVNGFSGASLSTLGIFLPSFIFVALVAPFINRLRSSHTLSLFIDGVNAASLGLMYYVLLELAQKSFTSIPIAIIGLAAFLIHIKFSRINSAFLLLTGGFLGFFFF
jgi:chromate transporter